MQRIILLFGLILALPYAQAGNKKGDDDEVRRLAREICQGLVSKHKAAGHSIADTGRSISELFQQLLQTKWLVTDSWGLINQFASYKEARVLRPLNAILDRQGKIRFQSIFDSIEAGVRIEEARMNLTGLPVSEDDYQEAFSYHLPENLELPGPIHADPLILSISLKEGLIETPQYQAAIIPAAKVLLKRFPQAAVIVVAAPGSPIIDDMQTMGALSLLIVQ